MLIKVNRSCPRCGSTEFKVKASEYRENNILTYYATCTTCRYLIFATESEDNDGEKEVLL